MADRSYKRQHFLSYLVICHQCGLFYWLAKARDEVEGDLKKKKKSYHGRDWVLNRADI